MARQPKTAVKHTSVGEAGPVLHTNLPIIEVSDGWLLDAVLSDPAAGRTIALRLSERVAVVTPGQLDALFTRLRKLGHIPRMLEE